MAPVVLALRRSKLADVRLCLSGQHQGAMATVLAAFGLRPDVDLQAMQAGQGLSELAAKILTGVDHEIRLWRPDLVLVHGDTTTASAAALAAFHARATIAHVEAGLRTHDLGRPWPEEANRRIVGMLATLHFAPTPLARDNLLAETVNPSNVEVTGNTVVDALIHVRSCLDADPQAAHDLVRLPDDGRRIVLVTGHRRKTMARELRRSAPHLLRSRTAQMSVSSIRCIPIRALMDRSVRGWAPIRLSPCFRHSTMCLSYR